VYDGEFAEGKKTNGKLQWLEKYFYEGPFVNDNMEGEGKMVWIDGTNRLYEGDFKMNKFHGERCVFIDEHGNVYKGPYHMG